jgi:hypothetical protein
MIQYTMTEITEDNEKQFDRFKNNPPHPSYIAGFIDGDGCMFIRSITDGYQSGFTISQCRTNILQIIRYHFGGTITSSSNRNDKIINIMHQIDYYHKYNSRNQYNLIIRSNEYQILLEYLQNSFIIKESQYQTIYEFNKLVNVPNHTEEKEQLYLKCSQLNIKCNLNEIYLTRINIEYIAGLFDAEGCIYINQSKYINYYISISQKNHPIILQEIVNFLGFGKCYTTEFKIYKKTECLKFIQLVKNHLIVKYNQAIAFETLLETNDSNVKEQMYVICNREKHEIEIFTDLNQNDDGKERYLEKLNVKSLKEQVCREIHNKQVYREKSEKMKGDGNHNYGKTFSEETKKKMSKSIREAKGGISDENIIQVRKMIKDGYKNIEIQDLLAISRHTITRIKNGEIVCRDEEKKEKNTLTQEEVNLSKRKINADDIIIVIEKTIEKWKPTKILDYFIEENKTNITIDIIKNIKRNLINRKKIIYESELSKERYEYYTILIKQFTETLV